jgi:thymidylate synthase ThyX
MKFERAVYLLDPQKHKPETIAVTFAKTSRSPKSFREIADDLTDDSSARFHEKWVLGYGHASVAEHAVLHLAVENISRLAVEELESNRLASYTEKSTRYQKWDENSFYLPDELKGHRQESTYIAICKHLFSIYRSALPAIRKDVEQDFPRRPDENEEAWEIRIRSEYVDVCRFLLPAASFANVGVTINARALEHSIKKMLSHPLSEVRAIGKEIKQVAQANVPTLVKYADHVPYLQSTRSTITAETEKIHLPEILGGDWCTLIAYDSTCESRIIAAALYRYGKGSYEKLLEWVEHIPPEKKSELTKQLLGKLNTHDIPIRELEHTYFTFDVSLDQGAYFELKRHRMMTQTPQALSPHLGYASPLRFASANLMMDFHAAMNSAREAYEQIAIFNPQVASYVVPNAFNRRVLLTFNLRTADHFIALRTAPNAHFSIRRIACRIAEIIRNTAPLLSQYLRINPTETWQEIEQQHFTDMNNIS